MDRTQRISRAAGNLFAIASGTSSSGLTYDVLEDTIAAVVKHSQLDPADCFEVAALARKLQAADAAAQADIEQRLAPLLFQAAFTEASR